MPLVTGEPQLGGEEIEDVLNDEKGRPPDEIYEYDKMDTSSMRFPFASTSEPTKTSAQDTKQLGSLKRLINWVREGMYRRILGESPSEDEESGKHTFQQQRARLVHGTWASIENVCKISSSLLVNKPQCEHIADHFKVIGDVLKKLGLGKDFVPGKVLEGGSGSQINFDFDETRFNHIAETFVNHFNERDSSRLAEIEHSSRKFHKYIRELPAMDGSSEESFSALAEINEAFQDYGLSGMSLKEIADARLGHQVQHRLDEFLHLLFGVLKYGEDLVLFHVGLEGANNGVAELTGLSGEEFVKIHELLYELLDCYACLEHCEGSEFASGYLSRVDVCEAESILYFWNLNCLKDNTSLVISDDFLSIEMATKIANLLRGPNHTLRELSIRSSHGVKVDQEELRKCRSMIIGALSEGIGLTSLIVHALNGKEVHDLCKSLRANWVLENLVISTDGPLSDNNAMDLRVLLGNHSLKSFTLEFEDVSPKGIVYLGAMLAEISLEEIYLKARGLSRDDLKYLLGIMMAYIDGNRNVIFSLEDKNSYLKIWRLSCEGRELPERGSDDAPKLHIIKKPNNLSIKFADLDPDAVCEILDSLKKNKTLQLLDLGSWPRYGRKHADYRQVAASLEALLAENSSLRVLTVHFCAWDKYLVTRLLRPLMAEKDGQPPVNNSLRQLHMKYEVYSGTISVAEFSTDECDEVIKSIARIIRTNKTLIEFSMNNADLTTSDICEVADSLKTNKALQVLCLDCEVNAEVKVAFIDLLVHYNFTLETIRLDGTPRYWDIENFMKRELKIDSEIALRGLWSLVDHPKRAFNESGALSTNGESKEVCGSSKRAFDEHKSEKEAKDERTRLILSYSNERRDFARLLCEELKSSNYIVVDQDSINVAEVVDQCQLAIVVLSDEYVNCKPSMSELCTIVKSKTTNNKSLKVYPVFYKLTLYDLQNAYVPISTFGGEGSSLDIALEREGLNFLCEGKNEVSRKANDLVENLSQGRVDVLKFCEDFSELQRNSWPSNGLEFEKNAISEEGCVHTILEEIFHYMPATKDCNNDQIFGHQGKLEMESKLSLQQMKPLLESLPMTNFYLLRKFNMAQSIQEKYIQYSSFEKMCLHLGLDQKYEYSKGRIAAALFPKTFLYHFKVYMFQGPHDGNFRPMLKVVATWVAEKMQKECNQNGVQSSTFFDFVDLGAPFDPSKTIAMCQNFPAKTSDGSKQLVIVQDDLTGAYYYQCDEGTDPRNIALKESIGVIGVQVTSEEIHIDNIHDDGSSYSGVLGDFSCKFDSEENKQCAAKAFGDLAGAKFLSKNNGIKCSPLLVIALASAIQKKGLTLTWSNDKGHMEFDPKLSQKVKMEASACQIQYNDNIKQLGLEIEWGTDTISCVIDNQTLQRKTNEIVNQQVIGSYVDGSVNTSDTRDVGSANAANALHMQEDTELLKALVVDKSSLSLGLQVLGNGMNITRETSAAESKQLKHEVMECIQSYRYSSNGGFYRNPILDVEYPKLEEQLLNGQLHEVDHDYLVVYNVPKARHISIYEAIKQTGVEPKFELTWISDIHIKGGQKEIENIFATGLRGRELNVIREGSNFTQFSIPPKSVKNRVPGYQGALMKIKRTFESNAIKASMILNAVPNPDGKLKSKNEWVHIIGHQEIYEASCNYWWETTPMKAIVYSRTMYKSGLLLKPRIDSARIGYCSVEGPTELKHLCSLMESRGKFSRRSSPSSKKVLWGGLETLP